MTTSYSGRRLDIVYPLAAIVVLTWIWAAHLHVRYLLDVDSVSSICCATGTVGEPVPTTLTQREDFDRFLQITDHSTFANCISAMTGRYHHPPAYFLLLNVAMQAFGAAGIVGTALSASFALAALAVVYVMLRRHASPAFASVGVVCYGVSSGVFDQSLCVRHYTLMLFANLVVLYMALRISDKMSKQSRVSSWEWILLMAAQALSMWTQYLSVFELTLVNAWLIFRCGRDGMRFWRPYLISLTASALLFSFWIPHVIRQRREADRMTERYVTVTGGQLGRLGAFCEERFVQAFFRVSSRFPLALRCGAWWIVAACAVCAWRQRNTEFAWFGFFALAVAFTYFGLTVVGLSPHYFADLRFTLSLAANLWIVLLLGVALLNKRARIAAMAVLVLLASATEAIRYFRDTTRPAAMMNKLIACAGREADLIVLDDPSTTLARICPARKGSWVLVHSQPKLVEWIRGDMPQWAASQNKSPETVRVLYAPNISRQFAPDNSREGMLAVIDQLKTAGLELRECSSPPNAENEDNAYAFYFVGKEQSEAVERPSQ